VNRKTGFRMLQNKILEKKMIKAEEYMSNLKSLSSKDPKNKKKTLRILQIKLKVSNQHKEIIRSD